MISRCRVCQHALPPEPVLSFQDMPRAAQHLPGPADLEGERGLDLRVLQCPGCGLAQLDAEPVPYYRDVIRAAGVSPEMGAFRRGQFGDWVARHGLAGKKVVEIGCGRGEYLALLRESGVDAHGLEHAAAAVADCTAAGLPASRGFVRDRRTRIPGAPFDGFAMLSFLEHLPRPNDALAGIRANLAPGAVGLVEVPDFGMIIERALFSEFIPDHLTYFTAETLRTALAVNGFEVLQLQRVWHDYILSATVRRRERLDTAPFVRRREELTREIDAFVSRFGERRVAVWGAGHQALALLSLASLAGRVRYVVDSAPFKQGRFTPATHIPIVPPERLDADPVEAVIVMAAGYSDEVCGLVRSRHGAIGLAIVRERGLEIVSGAV